MSTMTEQRRRENLWLAGAVPRGYTWFAWRINGRWSHEHLSATDDATFGTVALCGAVATDSADLVAEDQCVFLCRTCYRLAVKRGPNDN